MAVPNVGKCVVLLVFVLIIYTGYAFKIRDAVQSSTGPNEQLRSSVCSGGSFGKCPGDTRADLQSTSKRKYERVDNDANRARFASKSRQPPVETEASEESTQDDDEGGEGTLTSYFSSAKVAKWARNVIETKKGKFGRSVVREEKVAEESEEAVVTEEENDEDDAEEIDADSDDDGVEVSDDNDSQEGESLETIIIDADDDDDDGDDDESDELSNEIDQNEEDGDDNGGSDEETTLDTNDDTEVANEDQSEEKIRVWHKKVDKERKVTPKSAEANVQDSDEEDEPDITKSEGVKKQLESKVIKESGKQGQKASKKADKKESDEENQNDSGEDKAADDNKSEGVKKQLASKVIKESGQQFGKDSLKKVVKKVDEKDDRDVNVDDDETDEDDDETDEDDDENDSAPVIAVQPPLRKLEKVRLADKDKVKSIEVAKPVKSESVVTEKLAEPRESTKKIDETKKTKTKDTQEVPITIKSEAEIPTKSNKTETNEKSDISAKPVKDAAPKKSDTPKPVTTKTSTKLDAEKTEKVVVAKTKDDKSKVKGAVKQSEKSSEPKSGSKNVDSGVPKKDQSKPKAKKRVDASISLTELNDAILRVPTFVPNFTAVEDPACQQHGKIFLRQLRGYKLWALQMLDASAKIPSGLLRGNINQLGDFDQCLGITARVKVDEKTVKVQGKYCLATLDLHASLPDMKVPVNFMQSRGFIRGSMRDPGHFVPRFTTGKWAMCIPAACSAEDARSAIESALSHLNGSSGVKFTVDVNPEMCYVRQKAQTYSKETLGVLYFYAMIICVVLVATVRDYVVKPQEKGSYSERIIMSFSLGRTLKILTKEGRSDAGEISCIHGIRSLATIALYVAHKIIPVSQIPYANRISLTEVANNPISSVLRASLAYTDCFLLLSGVLTAFNMARESTKRGEIRWFCRFVARFIRLTPALLVMVFWYAYVMEHTGSGPQWNSVVVANAELCKQNSWTNLLYIQNFFPFEEMCATHTHQLALDMQLSLLAPIFVFFLTFKSIIGILLIFFLLQVSATLRYFATTNNNLSLVIFHGMSMKQLYKTANLTYALPLHRATPYIFGVGLGVLLHYTGKNVRIYRIFVILGWLTAAALGSWSLFSPWRMARRDYTYDVEDAAHYAVIAPIAWSIALCWIIFACFTEHGGVVNKFLSSYWMTLFSRISYAVYLCQFAIFFYNVGTMRYSTEFQIHRLIDPYEAIVVTLASVILTLFIDIPMQEVKNVIMESTDGLTIPIVEAEPTAELQESAATNEESAIIAAEQSHPEEEVDVPHWDPQDDAIDGLSRVEDSADEEVPVEKWRRQSKSNGRRRSYVRRETYEDEDDEEEYESERAEWDWVKRPGSRMSVEDDGLVERGRRSRSSQRPGYLEPDTGIRESSTYPQYQRDDDYRRERRSLSRQPDRALRREESPRSSLKRERSTSRAPEPRRSSGQEYEQTSPPSWETTRRERSPRRERSTSRVSEPQMMQQDIEDQSFAGQFSRSEQRSSFSGREYEPISSSSWESGRNERSPRHSMTPRREPVRVFSSGSEDDPAQHPSQHEQRPPKIVKRQPSEPKVSDEEDWEQELRIRRRKFMERLASEDRDPKPPSDEGNDGWDSVKRRSSAEGKMALLKGPTGSNVMDSWTISRGPRVSLLGSSQETEDDVSYVSPAKDYREGYQESALKEDDRSEEESGADLSRRRSYTSGSQVTSLEEEDDVANNDFVLKQGSKRITVMDLSKLSQQEGQESEEETAGWKVVKEEENVDDEQPKMATLKLFKRESIVKSQASEEDPEYLLPERPKLMEQEQDHPFKKAWQLQKSRSEEDGPSAYALKEIKTQPDTSRNRKQDSKDREDSEDNKESTKSSSGGGQSILEISHNNEPDTTTIWLSRSVDVDDSRSSSKSGTETDSSKLDWPSEDEQFNRYKLRRRRQSEEANYGWELEET